MNLITFEKKYRGTIYINPEHVESVEFGDCIEINVDGETFERWDSVVHLSSGNSVSVFGCAIDVAKSFAESSEMKRLFGWYDSNGDSCDNPTTKNPKT